MDFLELLATIIGSPLFDKKRPKGEVKPEGLKTFSRFTKAMLSCLLGAVIAVVCSGHSDTAIYAFLSFGFSCLAVTLIRRFRQYDPRCSLFVELLVVALYSFYGLPH